MIKSDILWTPLARNIFCPLSRLHTVSRETENKWFFKKLNFPDYIASTRSIIKDEIDDQENFRYDAPSTANMDILKLLNSRLKKY